MANLNKKPGFPSRKRVNAGSLPPPLDPETGLPVLRARRAACGCCLLVDCCYCGTVHNHGAPLGARVGTHRGSRMSHCADPYRGDFYIISEHEGDGAR